MVAFVPLSGKKYPISGALAHGLTRVPDYKLQHQYCIAPFRLSLLKYCYLSPADILWVHNSEIYQELLAYKHFFKLNRLLESSPIVRNGSLTQILKWMLIEGDTKLPQLSYVTGGRCCRVVNLLFYFVLWKFWGSCF